jgi:hypothetical protein
MGSAYGECHPAVLAKEPSAKFELTDCGDDASDDDEEYQMFYAGQENPAIAGNMGATRRPSASMGDISMIYSVNETVGDEQGILQQELAALRADNTTLRDRLDALTASFRQPSQAGGSADDGVSGGRELSTAQTLALLSKVAELEEALASAAGHTRRVAHLEEANKALQDSIDRKNESTRSMVTQMNALLADMAGLQKHAETSEMQVADMSVEISALRNELKGMSGSEYGGESTSNENEMNLNRQIIRLSAERERLTKSEAELTAQAKKLQEENDKYRIASKELEGSAGQSKILALEVKALQTRDSLNRQKIKHLEETLDSAGPVSSRDSRKLSQGSVTAMSLSSSLPSSSRPISYNRAKALEADLGSVAALQNALTSLQDKLDASTLEREKLKKVNELLETEKQFNAYRQELEDPASASLVDYLNEQLQMLRAELATARQRTAQNDRIHDESEAADNGGSFYGSSPAARSTSLSRKGSSVPRANLQILPSQRKSIAEMQGVPSLMSPLANSADSTPLICSPQSSAKFFSESEVDVLKQRIAELESELDSRRFDSSAADGEQAALAQRLRAAETTSDKLQDEVADLRDMLAKANDCSSRESRSREEERVTLLEQISDMEAQLRESEEACVKSRSEMQSLQSALKMAQAAKEQVDDAHEADMARTVRERDVEAATLRKLLEVKDQDISALREDARTRSVEADTKVTALSQRVASLVDDHSALSTKHKQEICEVVELLNTCNVDNATLRQRCEAYMREREGAAADRAALQAQVASSEEVSAHNDRLQRRVGDLNNKVDDLNNKVDELELDLIGREEEVAAMKADYELLKEALLGMSRKHKQEKHQQARQAWAGTGTGTGSRNAATESTFTDSSMLQTIYSGGDYMVGCIGKTFLSGVLGSGDGSANDADLASAPGDGSSFAY